MFHQIYATYSKEAAVKGFNPLMDDGCLGELKGSDRELMLGLRGLLEDPNDWSELEFLCDPNILPTMQDCSYVRDRSVDYTGKLIAKFLMSFTHNEFKFGPR
jgi:hypothetical protein